MADTAVLAQPRLGAGTGSDVSARLQQLLALLFPSNFTAKAVLFAVVVALLPLLPTSQTHRIWELPHLLLLGLVISYGVFGQRNADTEVTAGSKIAADDDESVESYVSQMMQGPLVFGGNDGDGDHSNGGAKDGVQAWSSQYYPDDPLVFVADAGSGVGNGGASEKPLLLPVRKLKPAAAEESTTGYASDGIVEEEEFFAHKEAYGGVREHTMESTTGYASDGIEEEEEEAEFFAHKEAYGGVREHTMPSPSSVLDADLTLSPCSPPPPPPPPPFHGAGRSLRKAKARSFNEHGARDRSMSGRAGVYDSGGNRFRSNSATQATRRSAFAGYDLASPFDDQAAANHELFDETVAAASDSSFSSDAVTDGDDDKEEGHYEEDEDEEEDSSCDEELFELATRPAPEAEAEEEVDRKADEFIAKFREQIRMQRVEPGRR